MKRKESAEQTIKRLEGEKRELLALLNRYMPSVMAVPRVEEYERWRADNERVRQITPGWR